MFPAPPKTRSLVNDSKMDMDPRGKALVLLRKCIDEAPAYTDEFAQFEVWARAVRLRTQAIFGLNSKNLDEITPPLEALLQADSILVWDSPYTRERTREEILGILSSFYSEVQNLSPDETSETLGQPTIEGDKEMPAGPQDNVLFVVHGRNRTARDALFTFLRSIGLHPLEWSEAIAATGKSSPYIGEILDAAFSIAQAVIVLMTPDDEARLRDPFRQSDDPPYEAQLTPQARPNVLFEAGMAMGRSPDRTVLVELGLLRPFSDIAGRHTIKLDDSTQRRQQLANRLQTAKCRVNLSGTDWHTAGDFGSAIL